MKTSKAVNDRIQQLRNDQEALTKQIKDNEKKLADALANGTDEAEFTRLIVELKTKDDGIKRAIFSLKDTAIELKKKEDLKAAESYVSSNLKKFDTDIAPVIRQAVEDRLVWLQQQNIKSIRGEIGTRLNDPLEAVRTASMEATVKMICNMV